MSSEKFNYQASNKPAFTLAELLITTAIIAFVLTLFAPVLTKRAYENMKSTSSGFQSKLYLYDKSNPDCEEIAGVDNTLQCKFNVPNGVSKINAILVSGGGGGAGASAFEVKDDVKFSALNPSTTASTKKELTISQGMSNVVITELIGSGAGGGGAAYTSSNGTPKSQADCDPFNALFIPASYNGSGGRNSCVTKYNVGDTYGPSTPSGVRVVSAGSNCSGNCCWQGNTSTSCTATGNGNSTYSGCNRTVCTRGAAYAACSKWAPSGTRAGSWRLPTQKELTAWKSRLSTLSKNMGDAGLQLCDGASSASNGSVRCPSTPNCFGARSNTCYSRYIWTGSTDKVETTVKVPSGLYRDCIDLYVEETPGYVITHCNAWGNKCISNPKHKYYSLSCYKDEVRNKTTYIYYDLYSGQLKEYDDDETDYAASVRCVLDGSNGGISSNSVFSGGGGAAGSYIKNYQIPNDIITSNIGGKIVLYAAAGGTGGNSSSSSSASGSNGTNGSTSYVEVYDKNNVLKWGIRAPGGNAGYGATSSSAGSGGSERAVNSCQLFENGSWRNASCTGAGSKGYNGTNFNTANSVYTANGGNGGGSRYNSATDIGYGAGGTASSQNGGNASVYGAGGGGATIKFDSSNNPTTGKGGSGANGAAEIAYDFTPSCAAGGGGGGGAFASVKNIDVTQNTTYTLKVGAGGAAGINGMKGLDGGESSISFNTLNLILSGGKGGNAGISQTDTTAAQHGLGGAGGTVTSNTSTQYSIESKEGSKGEDGSAYTDSAGNIISKGGNGGDSGSQSKGGFGGFNLEETQSTHSNPSGKQNEFQAPSVTYSGANYGTAGAGGGAGGYWYNNSNPLVGDGAQGQMGYVYLYWQK